MRASCTCAIGRDGRRARPSRSWARASASIPAEPTSRPTRACSTCTPTWRAARWVLRLVPPVSKQALESPQPIDCWLAISENQIGPRAYRPQEIVRALNGTSIQVIHTDAEGRMVLADTLALAAQARPAAIIDYATLTGACVYALTERYSGAFTNRPAARERIEGAG